MRSHCTATAWDLSDLDRTLTRRPLGVSRADARFMCSAPAFCAWRRLPLICWKLLMVCVYETGSLLLFAYIALLLLPLSFVLGVDAPSLSLVGFIIKAVRRGSFSLSFSLFVVASAACVYETGLLLVCACRALLLLPLSLFLGVRAPSLSLGGFRC